MENILNNFLSYGFLENKNDYKFLTFSKTLTKKDVIKTTRIVLNYILNEDIDILRVKKFLTLFLIIYFKESFFSYNTSSEYLLNIKALKLFDIFKEIVYKIKDKKENINYDEFKIIFDKFIILFDKWKLEDKFNIINEYMYLYKQCEGNLKILNDEKENSNDYPEYQILFIESFKKKIKLNAEKICPEFEDYVKEFTVLPVKLKFNNSIISTARKAYFDIMKSNIEKEEFNMLEKFLFELQERLILLTPNNKKEHDYLKEYFDVELIMSMIRNKSFNFNSFVNWTKFVLDKIKVSQKPIDDEKHKNWVKDFFDKIETTDFNISIIKFLEYSITRVEKIEEDIKIFSTK